MISFELSSEIPKCVLIQIFDAGSILIMGSALCMISFIHYHFNPWGGGGGVRGGKGGGGKRGEGVRADLSSPMHSLGVILTPCPLAFSTQFQGCTVQHESHLNDQLSQSQGNLTVNLAMG